MGVTIHGNGFGSLEERLEVERELSALRQRVQELEGSVADQERRLRVGDSRTRALRRASARILDRASEHHQRQTRHLQGLSHTHREATTRLSDVHSELAAQRERAEALEAAVREHQSTEGTLVAALSAAEDVLTALEKELRAASQVQHLSKRIGTLSFPKGGQGRWEQPDHPLYEHLLKAQASLKASWDGVVHVQDELEQVQSAVSCRVRGGAWADQVVVTLKDELAEARVRIETLEREQRIARDELEDRAQRIHGLEEDLAQVTREAEADRRELTERLQSEIADRAFESATQRRALEEAKAAQRRALEQVEAKVAEAEEALHASQARHDEEVSTRKLLTRDAMHTLQALEDEIAQLRESCEAKDEQIRRMRTALHRDKGWIQRTTDRYRRSARMSHSGVGEVE